MKKKRILSILDLLRKQKRMSIAELALRFSVSPITMRQDLKLLEKTGNIQRSYGEAIYIDLEYIAGGQPIAEINTPDKRFDMEYSIKEAMACEAVKLLWEDATIYIDDSSTCAHLASFLHQFQRLTVITNNMSLISPLSAIPSIRLLVLGGLLSNLHLACIGKKTIDQLSSYDIDFCFIGASALNFKTGSYENSPAIAEIKKCGVAQSNSTILMATHSKFNNVQRTFSSPWSDIKYFITDVQPDQSIHNSPEIIIP